MTLASWMPWKRVKPADPMQAVQTDPRTEDALDKVAQKYRDESEKWKRTAMAADAARIRALAERNAAWAALREIRSMVTPGCASIGRRMAAKAAEPLPEYAAGEREAA